MTHKTQDLKAQSAAPQSGMKWLLSGAIVLVLILIGGATWIARRHAPKH
ncbi:hypothetical protein [Levilactobacillus suantsaii]|nr:hypothetical protein [Levilactobacillus suantsaii]QMU08542.1 hypothetical protein H3M12_02370 [Levilactobacillus suantsaii]